MKNESKFGKTVQNLLRAGSHHEDFAQIGILDRHRQLGKNSQILRLAMIGAANEKDKPDRGLIDRVPFNPLFLLDTHSDKEILEAFEFGVRDSDAEANARRNELFPLEDCFAKYFAIRKFFFRIKPVDQGIDRLIASGHIEKFDEWSLEIVGNFHGASLPGKHQGINSCQYGQNHPHPVPMQIMLLPAT
ncbi:MAG: hypothetical protein HW387_1278 [Parachlamydiales bacterium]|nr:hypothetical protein [Parachlamydiales bacterium]